MIIKMYSSNEITNNRYDGDDFSAPPAVLKLIGSPSSIIHKYIMHEIV